MTVPLHVASFCLGDWMTNCYVLHVQGEQTCWIVDAGFGPQPLIDYVKANDLKPQQVILTHAHIDHIAGLSMLRAHFPAIPILIHPQEKDFLADPMLNLSGLSGAAMVAPEATGYLEHGQTITLDGTDIQVRHTPGHSPGGIALYAPQIQTALVGDTLFAGSVGRTDFPTSDPSKLFESIRGQLLTMPDQTRVLAGHGPDTTIEEERRHNPFL